MYRILLSEPIDEAGMAVLRGKAEVHTSPDPGQASVAALLKNADALIVRTATQITADMIRSAERLKVISRTGGGLNNVDIKAATDSNVVVCGVKGPQDLFVAEHAMSLIAALAKSFAYLDQQTRSGNFKSRSEYRPVGLFGKRLGLIGLGRIGRKLAAIASTGFHMEVTGYDPYLTASSLKEPDIRFANSITEVLQTADFLSVHVPLTEETRHLINRKRLALMKPTAYLINTSRGEVVEEAALIDALRRKVIAGAGLDVFETEPPDPKNPLFSLQNVIVTPHSAALTKEVVAALAQGAAENALQVLKNGKPSYSPNWQTLKDRQQCTPTNL